MNIYEYDLCNVYKWAYVKSYAMHVHAYEMGYELLGITWQKRIIKAAESFNFSNENSHVIQPAQEHHTKLWRNNV